MDLTFHGADVGPRGALDRLALPARGRSRSRRPRARELCGTNCCPPRSDGDRLEALLDDVQPELVVFNERNYAEQGPLCDIALSRGLNVIQFVGGFEDDTLVFKRYTAATKGIHPRSLATSRGSASSDWLDAASGSRELDAGVHTPLRPGRDLPRALEPGLDARAFAGRARGELGLDPARKTAVVFSHVLWDANMFYGTRPLRDQEEWFVETVRAACANDRVNWMVKLHPANVWKLQARRLRGRARRADARSGSTSATCRRTSRSSTRTPTSARGRSSTSPTGAHDPRLGGFELPCFGRPALTAGTGFYSGRGFTVDSESREEYLGRLARIEEIAAAGDGAGRAGAQARVRAVPRAARRGSRASARSSSRSSASTARRGETRGVGAGRPRSSRAADDLRRLGDWAVELTRPRLPRGRPALVASDVLVRHDGSGDPREPERCRRQRRREP